MTGASKLKKKVAEGMHQGEVAWSHPGNQGHRVRSLYRLSAFHLRGRLLHRRTQIPIGQHSSMWADLSVVSTIHAVIGNPPDWAEMQAWRRVLRPGDLFVDVGASAGSYTLWAADLGASVIAVEPDPTARGLLEDNVALNVHANVEIVAAAMAGVSGTMKFTSDLGTMNQLVMADSGGTDMPVRTLDEVLGNRTARGVKIDVEGAERLVLDGASEALQEGRVAVFQLEWNSFSGPLLGEDRSPIVKTLAAHGYHFWRPDREGHLRPADVDKLGGDVFAVLDTSAVLGDQ